MSLIGTFYKEPRVFAHSMKPLSSFVSIPNQITTVTVTPITAGESYSATTTYATTGGSGYGAEIEVNTVGGSGEVTAVVAIPTTLGPNYKVGDILTLVGGDGNCTVEVDAVTDIGWTEGYPLNPAPSLPANPPTSTYDPTVGYLDSQTITYTTDSGLVMRSSKIGAGVYCGSAGNLEVIMEDGNMALIKGIAAGSFLPISILTIDHWDPAGTTITAADILIIY